MDYARKIGKSEGPPKWITKTTTHTYVNDGLIRPDQCFSEDSRLVNWRTWLERRKKQYDHIRLLTGRQETDQTLNSGDHVREQIEMRSLIDYAIVPVPILPDKYRGEPKFWRTSQTLPNRRDTSLPEIAITPSRKETNSSPEITYVGLPELIKKEKHLAGLKSKEPLWKRSEYLVRRKTQLMKQIQLLVPKEPDTNDLVVRSFVAPKMDVLIRVPPITISGEEEDITERPCSECPCEGRRPSSEHDPDLAIVLKIQDREIVWQRFASSRDEQTETDSITWSLIFSGKLNRRTEKEIVFENKGNRVIIYQWRDATERCSLPLTRQSSPFFFNKTKGVISPGQIVKLKIWYQPRRSGVSTENWRLVTSPILCSSPLIFRFWGCAKRKRPEVVERNTVQLIDGYLDRCVCDAVVRETINIIMDNIDSVKRPEPGYGSLFMESEVFLAKNPLCSYNPSVLTEFHKIYYSVTREKDCRWNMSLDDLRDTLLNMKQSERKNTMLAQFSKLYKECLKPTLYSPVEYNKYEVVYSLLCSFFNLFETETIAAMNVCYAKCEEPCSKVSKVNFAIPVNVPESFGSNNSQDKRGKESSGSLQSSQDKEVDHDSTVSIRSGDTMSDLPYKEVFFIRIYDLLGETLVRIFATIESFNNLNERSG